MSETIKALNKEIEFVIISADDTECSIYFTDKTMIIVPKEKVIIR